MTAVSSVYAQRFLMTLFLISFGIYLFLATVTYTPFDPGWMHISSDTQQVSNASGVVLGLQTCYSVFYGQVCSFLYFYLSKQFKYGA
jgi:hypothetical protein